MRRYCKSALVALTAALALGACTSVDDTLGQSLIPPQQGMELLFKTLESTPFNARLGVNDSVAASKLGVIYIGQKSDAFGKTRAAAMTDFYPSTTTFNDSKYFGHAPVADSIFIDVMFNDIVGDATKEQTFNIYSMTDSLKRDSIYYMHMLGKNPDYPDRNQKTWDELRGDHLFSFKLSNKIPIGALALLKLEVTDKGKEFMQRLTTVTSEVSATPWPEFHKMFNGLFIEPAPGSPEDAAVYEMELRSSYSGFYMWYHNYDKESYDPNDLSKHHADTAYVTYDFSDTNWYSDSRVVNLNINNVTNQYPTAIQTSLDAGSLVSTAYVQSLGGLGTKLTATPELLAWLETLKKPNGTPRAVISRALLTTQLKPESQSNTGMNVAPTRLGMYYWFGNGTNIPDYDYAYEINNSTSSSSAFIPYGGYLSRSNGNYTMNITVWLTQLMIDPTLASKEIWLGPQVTTRSTQFNQVALDTNMKLDVAYTLTE